MKKQLFLALFFLILLSGCTKTIQGIQGDTSDAWHGTKRVIHEATSEY